MCCTHRLMGERRRRITNQGDVVAEFHREARHRFDACIGKQSHDDDLTDAVLLELRPTPATSAAHTKV